MSRTLWNASRKAKSQFERLGTRMSLTTNPDITDALAKIGRLEPIRHQLVEALRNAEHLLARPGFEVREHITGPIVDALFRQSKVLRKQLRNGLMFEFVYRSKIARDFVMSADAAPDHVWEPQTTKLLLHLCGGTKQVAIGGAYFGDQAVLVAHEMRESGGHCHCFEPNLEQARMLSRNLEINGLKNAVINCLGLWSEDDARLRLVGHDSHAHPVLIRGDDDEAATDAFPTLTLDTYGRKIGISHFDLIMLDIEGGEFAALQGAKGYLEQPRGQAPNVIFEIHRHYVDWSDGLDKTEPLQLLQDLGYTVFAVRDYQSNVPMADRPIELIPAAETYLEGPPHGFNMLAIKDANLIHNELFRIRRGVSPKLLFHRDPAFHQPIADT